MPDEKDGKLFPTERNPRLRLIIPLTVAMAFLMEQFDSTAITTAIPEMAKTLGTTPLRMNLAVTVYIVSLAVFIPVSGWFADRFGARQVFVAALIVFTLASALCGAAQNLSMLVTTRSLQGVGGAMMIPVARLILLRSFPRHQLFTAMIYMSVPALIGPVLGPLLGGVITDHIGWRWIFFVNIPFGCVGIALALWFLEGGPGDRSARFDFRGFLLLGAGLCLLQYGIENVGRPTIPAIGVVGVLAAATLLLLALVRHASKAAEPVVDLTLFRNRSFRISTLAGGISRIGINGVPFLLPLMLQLGFGMSPTESGLLTFCGAIGALLVRAVSTPLLRRLGFRGVLLLSSALGSAIVAGFALFQADTPYWLLAAYIALFGFIRAVLFMTSNTLTYADLPLEKLSRATSLGGVLQQLTISLGVSLSAMLLGLVTWETHTLTTARFHEVFLLMAVIPLLALLGFRYLRPEDGREVSGHQNTSRSA